MIMKAALLRPLVAHTDSVQYGAIMREKELQ